MKNWEKETIEKLKSCRAKSVFIIVPWTVRIPPSIRQISR